MSYSFENEADNHENKQLGIKEFYERLKNGERATTTLINSKTFENRFASLIEEGNDILYFGFSSALSGTYGSSQIARKEVLERYKDARIECIDTLAASLGEGLLVYYAAKMKQEGKSLDEVIQWVSDNKLHLCHWFTVDDLNHLKRGGRINAMTATIGTALGVKPILHVDNGGNLVPVTNVRGRKKSIKALLDELQHIKDPQSQTLFINHGDCLAEAEQLKELVLKEVDVKDVVINYVGPIIGSHTGPNMLCLVFMGEKR